MNSMPGFFADQSIYRRRDQYRANPRFARTETRIVMPAAEGPCPPGCYPAHVACTGFLLWCACWCPSAGYYCPTGGWWLCGGCFGFWQNGCHR